MKKLVIVALVAQSLLAFGCSRSPASMVSAPSVIDPSTGMSAPSYGSTDPYAGQTPTYSDPYAGQTGSNPYGSNPYGTTPQVGYTDPNNPYGTTPGQFGTTGCTGAMNTGYGANTGYNSTSPYGTAPAYGTTPGVDPYAANPYGSSGYGATTGQYGAIQYGGAMNTGVQCVDAQAAAQSQAILNKVTQDKSLFGMSQDDKIRESFKTNPSLAQMLPGMPVEHRVQMIKILLEGWASGDDKTLARQIWTSVPAAQQTQLTTSDSALKKLIGKL